MLPELFKHIYACKNLKTLHAPLLVQDISQNSSRLFHEQN
jgi:hypothetical protein